MLPASRRLKRSSEIGAVVRQGVRAATDTVVVHLRPSQHRNPPVTRVGFVVSKKVGNAVVRNRVKRRLRHIVAELNLPEGFDVVVRALPPAACSNLKPDLETALERALKRVPAC